MFSASGLGFFLVFLLFVTDWVSFIRLLFSASERISDVYRYMHGNLLILLRKKKEKLL